MLSSSKCELLCTAAETQAQHQDSNVIEIADDPPAAAAHAVEEQLPSMPEQPASSFVERLPARKGKRGRAGEGTGSKAGKKVARVRQESKGRALSKSELELRPTSTDDGEQPAIRPRRTSVLHSA